MQNLNPISFTEAAKKHIQSFLSAPTSALRIGIKKTGCSGYAYLVDVVEQARDQDLVFMQQEIQVYLAQDCLQLINGTVIDFLDKGTGQKQLVFNNPQAQDFCGCGESFTIKEEAEE